jgi:ABC-type lipoprotein export system ATPase subunit
MSEVLVAEQLCKDFTKGSRSLHVLRGIDLRLEEGRFMTITGASGAGKSTLLQILGGLDVPTSGIVRLAGKEIDFSDDETTSRMRNRRVGFVFQFHHLLPDFTALENTTLPGMIAGENRIRVEERARGILTDLGLYDRFEHRPFELSGGEQQRVAIARALVNEPDVLLMDEPTGNLDRKSGEDLMGILNEIRSRRTLSVVMVTHNEALAEFGDSIHRLEDGVLNQTREITRGPNTGSS